MPTRSMGQFSKIIPSIRPSVGFSGNFPTSTVRKAFFAEKFATSGVTSVTCKCLLYVSWRIFYDRLDNLALLIGFVDLFYVLKFDISLDVGKNVVTAVIYGMAVLLTLLVTD